MSRLVRGTESRRRKHGKNKAGRSRGKLSPVQYSNEEDLSRIAIKHLKPLKPSRKRSAALRDEQRSSLRVHTMIKSFRSSNSSSSTSGNYSLSSPLPSPAVSRQGGKVFRSSSSKLDKILVVFLRKRKVTVTNTRLLNLDHLSPLCRTLSETTLLKELVFADCTSNFIEGVAPAIERNKSITTLTLLSKHELNDSAAESLRSMLTNNDTLNSVTILARNMSCSALEHLFLGLASNSSISYFCLDGSDLSRATPAFNIFRPRGLKLLSLVDTKCSNDHLIWIHKVVGKHSNFEMRPQPHTERNLKGYCKNGLAYHPPQWAGLPSTSATLNVTKADSELQTFALNQKLLTHYLIGRDPSRNIFVLHHLSISRIHAVLQFDESGKPYLFDFGSRRGTFMNGEQIPPYVFVPIKNADFFSFGDSTRRYCLSKLSRDSTVESSSSSFASALVAGPHDADADVDDTWKDLTRDLAKSPPADLPLPTVPAGESVSAGPKTAEVPAVSGNSSGAGHFPVRRSSKSKSSRHSSQSSKLRSSRGKSKRFALCALYVLLRHPLQHCSCVCEPFV
eukprot:TRINITY_DN405_c0_g1_i6.p1 TRINITY_DN405_c0_g1~~TRINITY_DN405_c0_g1_i6.p1  ORF type:complete len:571 (-),score=91.49 TRINITY_DN405_c0_g1_i6:248-1936(-)